MEETNAVSPAPQDNNNEKLLAVLCHALGMIVIPLLVYLLKKDESPYLAKHAKQSLVWQAVLSVVFTIAGFVISALAAVTFGLGALLYFIIPPLALVAFFVGLYAAYQCWIGKEYRYPMIQSLVESL